MLLRVGSDQPPRSVLSYGRNIEACWSPDSVWLIVNDHEGSNSTRPYLFSAKDPSTKIDLKEWVLSHYRSKSVTDNHHVYMTAEWVDRKHILLSVQGYGEVDPSGFKLELRIKLDSGHLSIQEKTGSKS
jgi:hypothetical protein